MQRNYLVQQSRNLKKMEGNEFFPKATILQMIIELLNSSGIEFAISFSADLFFTGIVDTFNDIDITIHYYGDIERFKEILMHNGFSINFEKYDGEGLFFRTDLFLNCTYNGVQIEFFNGDFETSTLHFVNMHGFIIPLLPIETLFIQYSILEQFQPEKRRYKRELIEEYFKNKGISNPKILVKAKENMSLPASIRQRCQDLLIKNRNEN